MQKKKVADEWLSFLSLVAFIAASISKWLISTGTMKLGFVVDKSTGWLFWTFIFRFILASRNFACISLAY